MKINKAITLTAAALGLSFLSGASAYSATRTETGKTNTVFAASQKRDSKFETFTGTIAKKGDRKSVV